MTIFFRVSSIPCTPTAEHWAICRFNFNLSWTLSLMSSSVFVGRRVMVLLYINSCIYLAVDYKPLGMSMFK